MLQGGGDMWDKIWRMDKNITGENKAIILAKKWRQGRTTYG